MSRDTKAEYSTSETVTTQKTIQIQEYGAITIENFYIPRTAEQLAYQALGAGQNCFIAAPSGSGKSSLLYHLARSLSESGIPTIVFSLESLGSSFGIEHIYHEMANAFKQKFLYSIGRMVEYPSEAKSSDVFYRCLQQIQVKRNVVICIDEIGKLQNLSKYTKNSFFEMVRDLNNPPDDKKHTLPRINFCFSNTSPIPLFDQQDSLPAAQHIALEDFSWDEIKEALLPLFQKGFADAEKKLREVYEWTDGNPQMTCQIANRILYFPSKTVEMIVREIMMDDNTFFFTLNFISDHGGHSSRAKQLLCQQIMTNKNLPYDPSSPLHKYLITAGLLKNKARVLKIRNKIYQTALLKLR